MSKQRKLKKQGDLYFIWHMPTDCSLPTILELFLEALCKNEIKTGNDAIKTLTEMELFFYIRGTDIASNQLYLPLEQLALFWNWRNLLQRWGSSWSIHVLKPKISVLRKMKKVMTICPFGAEIRTCFFSSKLILLHRSFPAFCCPPTSPHNTELAW